MIGFYFENSDNERRTLNIERPTSNKKTLHCRTGSTYFCFFIFSHLNNCFFMPAGMALDIDRHRQTGNVAREQPDMNP
jgi:hypothetical protein